MARKQSKPVQAAPASPVESPRRGRPPLDPKTKLAHWLRAEGSTVKSFADRLAEATKTHGLPRKAAPRAKTLLDSVNGRHWPSAVTMLLVRDVTSGEVDLQDWVRDLYAQ